MVAAKPLSRARLAALCLLHGLIEVASTKWTLYAGSGTGPDVTVQEWASAVVSQYPDEVDISVWLSTGSHAQKALVGDVDCSKYRGHPTLCSSPPTMNHTDFGAGGITFSSSWYSKYSDLDIQQLPSLAGPVCVIYSKDTTGNLGSAMDRQLNLTMEVVGSIYGGRITFWDDPLVQALNPAITLPHERITVIARSDKSSLNELITSAISFANPWWTQVPGYMQQSVGQTPKWPLSNYADATDSNYLLQDGQEGIIVNALRRPFSIAYVDFTQIRRFGEFLASAQIVNNFTGQPVPPTPATVRNAVDSHRDEFTGSNSRMELTVLNPKAAEAYPLTRFTYWYITKSAASNGDCYRTWLLKELILYSYTPAAATIADRNGWVAPPESVAQAVRLQLAGMQCVDSESGQQMSVMDYAPPRYRRCPQGQYTAPRPGGVGINSYLGCRNCLVGSYQPQNDISGVFQCAAAPAGGFVSQPGQSTFQPCAAGTFSGTPAQSSCSACAAGKYSPTIGLTQCLDCPAGRSTEGRSGAQLCTPCTYGSYANSSGSGICQGCPAGLTTRSVGTSDVSLCLCSPNFHMTAPLVCTPCDLQKGLVCPGHGGAAQTARGYMLLQAAPQPGPIPDIYRCVVPDFCPGGGPVNCQGSREGVACSRCPAGHGWDGGAEVCEACSRQGWGWIVLWWLFVIAFTLFWLAIEVLGNSKMVGERYVLRLAVCGSVTSVVSVTQTVGLISLLTVPWPSKFIGFVRGFGVFLLDVDDALSFGCLIDSPGKQYAVAALTIPISLLTLVVGQLGRCCRYGVRFACPDFLNVVGALLCTSITPLMSSALSPMMCYTHPAGVKSLIKYPSVFCGSDTHHAMLALGTLLFLMGLSVISVLVVVTWKAPALASKPETSVSFLRAMRFLLLPYREDVWYAGCMLAPRGLLVALVPVILADSVHGQVILATCIIAACTALLARLWPWRMPLLNIMNTGVMLLLLLAMAIVSAAFVPNATMGSQQDTYRILLQVVLVFSGMVVGSLVAMIAGGILGRVLGYKTGDCLHAVLLLKRGSSERQSSRDLSKLILLLAGIPASELERSVETLEAYDRHALFRSLGAFKQLRHSSRGKEAWPDSLDSADLVKKFPSRCDSEAVLELEAELARKASAKIRPAEERFNNVMPSQARDGDLQGVVPAPPSKDDGVESTSEDEIEVGVWARVEELG